MTAEYKIKLEKGLQYQDFVAERLYDIGLSTISYASKKYQVEVGENKAGLEIKFDDKMKHTGNLYIETAEKSNAWIQNYTDSGIFRNDNTWLYVIGDYSTIFIMGKKQLRIIFHNIDQYREKGLVKKETPTSQGFLLPVVFARKHLVLKEINFINVA